MKMIFLAAAAAAAALIAAGAPVVAQTAADDPQASETVEVIAPYVVREKPTTPRRDSTRSHTTLVEVDKRVSFADLDLTKSEDQAVLVAHVRESAKDACAELDRKFPKTRYQPVKANDDCVKNATDEAMIQVKELIAAANEK